MWILAAALASESPREWGVSFDPHGTLLATAAQVIGVPAVDLNLRIEHAPQKRFWGWTAQVDGTWAQPLFLQTQHIGVRTGPRLALRGRGLSDWTFWPYLMVGRTTLRTAHGPLGEFATLGTGGEIGRTWVFGRFLFALGTGLYASTPTGYVPYVVGLADARPSNTIPFGVTTQVAFGVAL